MGQLSLDLNRYRTPSRFWERVENNWLIRTAITLGLIALVVSQLR